MRKQDPNGIETEPVPESRPPLAYRFVVGFVRLLMRMFFSEVACEGRELVPKDRGGLLVAWHPNGLIDPALIMSQFPGQIVFGARDGLLRWPIIGWMMRKVGTVPIFRASDHQEMSAEDRREANQKSLDALAGELVGGSFSALFPEGVSHDAPHLSELKSGAARLYYRARELNDSDRPPVIVPVGLHYDRKHIFRSDVLVTFHQPMVLPPDLDVTPSADDTPEDQETRIAALTQEIDHSLVRVVRATEDWSLHNLMHRARTLIRAEHAKRFGTEMGDDRIVSRNLVFAQIWHGYQSRRESHPKEIDRLRRDINGYHRLMRTMRLEDSDLDNSPRLASPLLVGLLVLQAVLVYLLLPPILLVGYLINGPVHFLIKWAADKFSTADKDTATVKILGGLLLYPLAWLVWGIVAAVAHVRLHEAFPAIPDIPFLVGVIVFFFGMLSGVLVLQYNLLASDTINAIRIRLTRQKRKESIDRLRLLRSDLFDRFIALKAGLVLPDEVTDLYEDQGQARPA